MRDWQKRYDAAQEEACAASLSWNEAESTMARANARRHNAERQLDAIFRERLDEVDSDWRWKQPVIRSHFDKEGCDPPQWYGPTGE